jgi:hypothetical protein
LKDYREALAAQAKTYVDGAKAGTALANLTVYRGLSSTELQHPSVIIHCPEARPYSPGLGIWKITLDAMVLTSLTEGLADTGVTHRARYNALTTLFDDASPATAVAGMTAASITCHGFEVEEMSGVKEDQIFAETLRLSVYAS